MTLTTDLSSLDDSMLSSLSASDGNPAVALQVDNGGNVGVGTTSPLGKLHLTEGQKVDPTLIERGTFSQGSQYVDVAVQGNFAYVVDSSSGELDIFDVSDPDNIVARGTTTTGLQKPRRIVVSGNYAYIIDWQAVMVAIFDISDPDNIVAMDTDNTDVIYPREIALQNNILYVGDRGNGTENGRLIVFNVSDPDNIVHMGTYFYPEPASPSKIIPDGLLAYIIDYSRGIFEVMDISDPTNMTVLGSSGNLLSGPTGLAVQNGYAYITDFDSHSVKVLNISDSSNISLVSSYSMTDAYFIQVNEEYLYATAEHSYLGDDELYVLDATNPSNIVEKDSIVLSIHTKPLLSDGFLYIADLTTLHIVEVSQPSLPSLITEGVVGIMTANPTTALEVNGTVKATAFEGDGSALINLDDGDADSSNEIQTLAEVLATGNDAGSSNISNAATVTAKDLVVRDPENNGAIVISPSNSGLGVDPEFVLQDADGNSGTDADFHLSRNAIFQTSNDTYQYIDDAGDEASSIRFENGGNISFLSAAAGTGTVSFHENMSTGSTTPLEVYNSSGNAAFQVHADGKVQAGRSSSFEVLNSSNIPVMLSNSSSTPLIVNDNSGSVALRVNGDGKVGIGANPFDTPLYVEGSADGADTVYASYIAHFRNTTTGTGGDVLMLEITTDPNHGEGNFIQFVSGGYTMGAIERFKGVTNGVSYRTTNSDFAEMLPQLDPTEVLEPGDVVGIHGGYISKTTDGADWVMAISTNPAFIGNDRYNKDDTEKRLEVAFVGQVYLKVLGSVSLNDYIVASGQNDGTAFAVSPEEIQPEQQSKIIGRAWESSDDPQQKLINCIVGLPESSSTSAAMTQRIVNLEQQVTQQNDRLQQLEARLNQLEDLLNAP